jgi:hypothetical protein
MTAVPHSAPYDGAGVYRATDGATITNTIVYDNLKAGAPNDINSAPGFANIGYSCSPDLATVLGGTGNTTNNPLFRNATNGDFRVEYASPCRNGGTHQAWMTPAALDLQGEPRIGQGAVDMGAYELPPFGSLIVVR